MSGSLHCSRTTWVIAFRSGAYFLLALVIALLQTVVSQDLEPSAFREFTDKRDQTIKARILSISSDHQTMKMEREDGNVFETAITILSLDDQQFIHEWLHQGTDQTIGSLKGFGVLAKGDSLELSPASGINKFTELKAMKSGWVALLPSGALISSNPQFDGIEDIAHVSCNTVWIAMTTREGRVLNSRLEEQHPEELGFAIKSVAGSRHMAAIMKSGEVKVWGQAYEASSITDPPGEMPPIVELASTQSGITALDEDGTIHRWNPDWDEIKSFRPGDGITQIEGTIFTFLGLSASGELYEWKADPSSASSPKIAEGEGPFVKIHCNGNTRAAQREDGTWFAWGTNGAGIVDRINELPPTPEITFFSEPSKENHGHLLYLEPES